MRLGAALVAVAGAALCLLAVAAPSPARLPPVYLNHVYRALDRETFEAAEHSDYLRTEFAQFEKRSTKWETLTADNKAADSGPKFSPDGKRLAWRAQKKAGYEADKWDIVVCDVKPDGTLVGKPVVATGDFSLSSGEFLWDHESTGLALVAGDAG